MAHRCSLVVRTYECDTYNHVNNAVYLNYLEYARLEFLKSEGVDYFAWRNQGCGVVIADIHIQYRTQAQANDLLVIETSPVEKGAAFGVVVQKIFKADILVAEARVKWVFVGPDGRPARLPEELKKSGFYIPC